MAEKTQLKSNQLILIGGGSSIKEGINKGLWDKLKGKFTIGLNYSYNFFDSTILCFADAPFYNEERKKREFKNISLIIGKEHNQLKPLPNTIILKTNDVKYYRNVRLGIWKSNLCGLFALSLAIYLLDKGTIFLLGYDYGSINNKTNGKGKKITHFYQGEIEHRGIGKVNYFDTIGRVDKDFGVFKDEKKVKIYNISVMSKINTFIKKDWNWFFENLDKQKFDQNLLRQYIREKLK